MNKVYVAMTMDKEPLNVGTIYFTDAFLAFGVVNPVTQNKYTEAEKQALTAADLTAPADGVIAISAFDTKAVLWFDAKSAREIVSHADALVIKGNQALTLEGKVVATAL